MKDTLITLLTSAINALKKEQLLPENLPTKIQIERTRDAKHGDFASNIALMLAKPAKLSPRTLAEKLVQALPASEQVEKVEIAGPGFINFFIQESALQSVIETVLKTAKQYGHCNAGQNQRIHIEYVSANPTGPLHVGHGRGAAFGACVANLLKAVGYDVHREYYVNDAGRQIRILALSSWLRYLELLGETIELPKNAYQGQYIIDIATELKSQYENQFQQSAEIIHGALPKTIDPETDKENYIDAYVELAQNLLGDKAFNTIREITLTHILNDIQKDLAEFGVEYEEWLRESQLFEQGLLEEGIELLKKHGHLYQKDGATWFCATKFGDEKDRVLVRENAQPTYFASDVAYHLYKYNQGYDQVIDVFGADHHGYIARLRAFLQGLGKNPDKLKILLVQFAILYRGKEKVSMSTRSGEFVTLRELRKEVGNDAARYFYIMRKPEQHLDFDLELAKSQSNDNPVFYIQYAHARICSVWRQLEKQQEQWDQTLGLQHLNLLNNTLEKQLINALNRYPEVLLNAAQNHEPHTLAYFLQEFANLFHSYYNANKFLVDDAHCRHARLCLIAAIQQVLANGLTLLGVSTPDKM